MSAGNENSRDTGKDQKEDGENISPEEKGDQPGATPPVKNAEPKNEGITLSGSIFENPEEQAGISATKEEARIKGQERDTANWLAKGILLIFAAVTITILLFVCVGWLTGKEHKDVLTTAENLLPYLATPLGVALGYYFTRKDK